MKFTKFNNKYFVRIDKGEELVTELKKFCLQNKVTLGSITGLGATNKVTLGLFNTETKEYQNKELNNDYELTNITGNITTMDGELYLHIHITLGDENYNSFGGHLNECWISGTCELVIDAVDGELGRTFDDHCGLNIFKID